MTERLLQNLKSTNMLFAIDFEKKKFHRTKRDRTIELYQLQQDDLIVQITVSKEIL